VTLSSHQKTVGASQVHLAPKWIIDALGRGIVPRSAYAKTMMAFASHGTAAYGSIRRSVATRSENGLPRLAEHSLGTALLHARTETECFRICWERATARPSGSPS
jgi:hypothetical protein